MFGERYFAARERLFGVMQGVSALSREIGADLRDLLPQTLTSSSADRPFQFLVCGEVNSGKSSFINALLGVNLCPVNVLPETSRVIHYRYGTRAQSAEKEPLLEERQHPAAILRDFQIIDTPGTNSGIKGHLPLIERHLATADLIFFIFPVSNPWGPATWDFMSKVPAHALDRIVIIVQQADQKQPADIAVILGHLKDLSMKRIGCSPPAFAVSAKLAADPDKAKASRSGYTALANHISSEICYSPERRATLESWRAQTAAALRATEDGIDRQTRALADQDRFLDQIEGEIGGMREHFIRRLPQHLSGVADVFRREAVLVSRQLGKRLGAFRSILRLFKGDRTANEIEALLVERLQAAIQSVAVADGTEVMEACWNHWRELADRVQATIGIDLADSHPVDETLAGARWRFVEQLDGDARKGISNLKVRIHLDRALASRNLALKSFTFTTLALITAGGTCGALAIPWVPGIMCGLAGAFLLGGLFIAKITARRIIDEFRDRLLDTCGTFANDLGSDYEEALRIVFQDYGTSLQAVRQHIVMEKAEVEPRLTRWKELFLTLKAIEQDL